VNLTIDQDRLLSEVEALAQISDAEPPAVTRVVFTPTDLKARTWLRKKCLEQDLAVRQDAIGNMFARWTGTDETAAPVATGSHIDAIPNAGKIRWSRRCTRRLGGHSRITAQWVSANALY